MQGYTVSHLGTRPVQPSPVSQTTQATVGASIAISILFPLSIGLAVSGYRKFRKNQLRLQVEKLERIWNLTHRR
jgi:hypothetical protein